jgi:flagellar biosynthetic protein FliR
LFLQALVKSLTQVPLDSLPAGSDLAGASRLVICLTGEAIRTGVSIAMPAALALFLSDLVLGFMNRTAPQIQVFFLGMPLKAIVGVGVVMLTLNGTLEHFLLSITA